MSPGIIVSRTETPLHRSQAENRKQGRDGHGIMSANDIIIGGRIFRRRLARSRRANPEHSGVVVTNLGVRQPPSVSNWSGTGSEAQASLITHFSFEIRRISSSRNSQTSTSSQTLRDKLRVFM